MRIILNPVVVDTQWGLQVLSKYFEDVDSLMQNAGLIDDSMLAARLKVDTDMDEADRDLLRDTLSALTAATDATAIFFRTDTNPSPVRNSCVIRAASTGKPPLEKNYL